MRGKPKFKVGDVGWWGMTINEHYDKNEWEAKVWELIDQCDDDTLFSFYDLHIWKQWEVYLV